MAVGKSVTFVLLVALAASACVPGASTSTESNTATTTPESNKPLDGKTITIDPGHNGGNADHPEVINEEVDVITGKKACNTTGTQTPDGYAEHKFNFSVAELVIQRLESAGAKVVTTRDTDDGVGPCITKRAAIGNEAHADAAVSIHADGGPETGRGFHIMEPVLLKGHNDEVVDPSHNLATSIAETYEDATGIEPADYIGDNGINPRDDMGGLNLSTVPVVMVECGNMANAQDAALLSDDGSHKKIAKGIVEGVLDFLS